MKIKNVEICNWRSIKNVEIDFQDLMIFIGQNNHGKSNILSAFLFFFNKIGFSLLDFNDSTKELYVEIIFHKLDDFDKNQFKSYLTSDDQIRVRKTANIDGSAKYNGYKEIPRIDWLKPEKISEFNRREIFETLPINSYLPTSGRVTIAQYQNAQSQYIQDNIRTLEFDYSLETTNFQGAVGKGIFGEVFYIPSVKDVSDELGVKGNSTFNQLYSRVIEKISSTDPKYKEAKDKLKELAGLFNKIKEDGEINEERPAEVNEFEENLHDELISWNTTVEVEVTPPNIDDIFHLNAEVWVDDGVRTDIKRKGNGLQRALLLALLKTYSKILEKERIEVIPENTTSTRGTSNSNYFIFEEPELYLHPQAQRGLFNTLIDLSISDTNQVILCTHSNLFVDLNYHKSICIVKKDNLNIGTKCLQCSDEFLSPEEKKNFNIIYWINPDRSELFFAKKIILLEGQTDKVVIPNLAKRLNLFNLDYTIVDCGGKNNIPIYIKLLNKFSLKYIAVFDKDHQIYKNKDGINSAKISTQNIINAVNVTLGEYVLLDNDIEEEIGIVNKSDKNKPIQALIKINEPTFNISQTFKEKIEKIFN